MKRCSKCGAEAPDTYRFCRQCGTALEPPSPSTTDGGAPATERARAERLLEEAIQLQREGNWEEVVVVGQEAARANPENPDAHFLLAEAYQNLGRRAEAIQEYERVLTLSPGNTIARERLNEILTHVGVAAALPPIRPVRPTPSWVWVALGLLVLIVVVGVSLFNVFQKSQQSYRPIVTNLRAPIAGQTSPSFLAQRSPFSPPVPQPGLPAPPPLSAQGTQQPSEENQNPPAGNPTPAIPPESTDTSGLLSVEIPGTSVDTGASIEIPGELPKSESGGTTSFAAPARGTGTPPEQPRLGGLPLSSDPIVSSPSAARRTQAGGATLTPTVESARRSFLQGDLQRAAQAYERALEAAREDGKDLPALHEELALVYLEEGDRRLAIREYRAALRGYEADLRRGREVEAARHGIGVCRTALRALGAAV